MKKYKNNTISKEFRKTLKKITFKWGYYKNIDPLERKANLLNMLNNDNINNQLKVDILKDQYYYNYY